MRKRWLRIGFVLFAAFVAVAVYVWKHGRSRMGDNLALLRGLPCSRLFNQEAWPLVVGTAADTYHTDESWAELEKRASKLPETIQFSTLVSMGTSWSGPSEMTSISIIEVRDPKTGKKLELYLDDKGKDGTDIAIYSDAKPDWIDKTVAWFHGLFRHTSANP